MKTRWKYTAWVCDRGSNRMDEFTPSKVTTNVLRQPLDVFHLSTHARKFSPAVTRHFHTDSTGEWTFNTPSNPFWSQFSVFWRTKHWYGFYNGLNVHVIIVYKCFFMGECKGRKSRRKKQCSRPLKMHVRLTCTHLLWINLFTGTIAWSNMFKLWSTICPLNWNKYRVSLYF